MDSQATTGPEGSGETAEDIALLDRLVAVVTEAGNRVAELFSPASRPTDRHDIFTAGRRNEETSLAVLRPGLAAARPAVGWVDDDQETTALPVGEWWAVDAVEGNVNHVHGMAEWAVTATLIRDNEPVLTAMHQPVGDLTYTARKGAGAWCNGRRLQTSSKTELADAIVATGQAESGQEQTYLRIGRSITAMLSRALLVRATVPSTFPLLSVAEGHIDGFWQYEPVLPGVAGGALLVREAGGDVTDLDGRPWRPGSPALVAAAAGIHPAVIDGLS